MRNLAIVKRAAPIVLVAALASAVGYFAVRRNSVVIDWNAKYQVIDGFGASSSNFVAPLSDEAMDFFYTTRGIGLTLLRTQIYADMRSCEEDRDPGGECVPSSLATVLTGELEMAKKVVAREGRVWGAEWSPPDAMKANGTFMKGGAFIANDANYVALADRLTSFVTLLRSQHVPVFALSPQNEPDISMPYSSATWTPQQIHDFVPYLHRAFDRAGVLDTRIMIAEESHWGPFNYTKPAMDDASVAGLVGILAAHNYDGGNPSRAPTFRNFTTQHVWETEASLLDKYDGGMANALFWAERLHYFLSKARINAFHYWYLSAAPNRRTTDEGLTDVDGKVALRAFAIGNWSKFVRPGWHEVSATNHNSLLVSAFQNDTGNESAVVVVNKLPRAVRAEFEVGPALTNPVVPWRTSRDQLLAPQENVNVVDGAFSYDVPAESIVTFVSGTNGAH